MLTMSTTLTRCIHEMVDIHPGQIGQNVMRCVMGVSSTGTGIVPTLNQRMVGAIVHGWAKQMINKFVMSFHAQVILSK